MTSVLCIGIGNAFRQDDGVGLYVAQKLRAQNLPDATIIEQSGEGTALAEVLSGASNVILIDAVVSGAAPGTLLRFDTNERSLPAHFFAHSTHAFGVAEAIELARAFGELPSRCLIFGIEGTCFEWGAGLTQSVEQAGNQLAGCLAQAIKDHALAVSLPCE